MARTGQRCESIYDLARQTGYSASTVSRVLNQRGRISRETRLQVLEAARNAGFRPRSAVRQNTIAIVLDRMRYATYGGFVASTLTHFISELARYDYTTEVYTEENISRLGTRFVDGVLALSWDAVTINRLRELKNVPIIAINRLDLPTFSTVATDHYQGGSLVAQYLHQQGHERIAFIAEERDWGAEQRIKGLRDTLEKLAPGRGEVFTAFTEHQALYGALRQQLDRQPTALFLGGEDLTIEATHLLTDMFSVRIPQDVSVVGMETARVSQFTHPPLTSLAQPLDKLAMAALDLLNELLDHPGSEPRQVVLENELIERSSVAPVVDEAPD